MRFYSKMLLVTSFLVLGAIGSAQPPAKDKEGGKGAPGRPGGDGGRPGAEGGRGGPGGRGMQPGQVLPPFLVEMLKLTDDQKKELAKLQKDTDDKLDKLLTSDQKKQLQEMKDRGPGREGDRGGPGRPGGDRGPEKKDKQ